MGIKMRRTERGFAIGPFQDSRGSHCSIQKSSLATEDAIWLGVTGYERMHLTQEQAAALVPLLQYFVETGDLPIEEE